MEPYNRRLLLLNEDEPSSSDACSPPRLTASPLSSSPFVTPLKLSAPVPFHSDVAYIVIIVLLLMAFLVLFIRRFADHSPASARHSPPASSNYHSPSSSCGGLDQTIVQSLPVSKYNAEESSRRTAPFASASSRLVRPLRWFRIVSTCSTGSASTRGYPHTRRARFAVAAIFSRWNGRQSWLRWWSRPAMMRLLALNQSQQRSITMPRGGKVERWRHHIIKDEAVVAQALERQYFSEEH